jgi:hypothetical protein
MSFILSAQRDPETIATAFQQYRAYLASNAASFPRGAHALATSEWYFDPRDHRCPHDAWLESITIAEPATGERGEQRVTAIRVRLLGAYHDGFIELFYPQVIRYSLSSPSSVRGLRDWRYDEFRLAPSGHMIHEIEWAGFSPDEVSRWIIEASDVKFEWVPR